MIKIEHVETYGWEAAVRGLRNPLNSWEKSDSVFDFDAVWDIGNNDHDLMMRLCKAGTEHRKFMRMITVTMDITAPLYWWKEWDTYKVGTVANSCSTMHTIHKKPFELDDFSHENLNTDSLLCLGHTVEMLNAYRLDYLDCKGKRYWQQLIQLLPSSYNQKRTVQLNYEVVAAICKQRANHKLTEWLDFIDIVKRELPYSELFTLEVE